jgi:hypothetical protein
MEGNCLTGCKHNCSFCTPTKEPLVDRNGKIYAYVNGLPGEPVHVCGSGHQKEMDDWFKRNAKTTYDVYSKDALPCYEPNEHTQHLERLNNMMEDILKVVDLKKKD